jgi:mono/diheme cytochrome c family protein
MGKESKPRGRVDGPALRGWGPALSLTLTALAACAPAETAAPGGDPVVNKVEGAPTAAATPITHTDVASDKPATVLSSLHGAIALGTSTGLLAGSLADDPPTAVPVVPDEGGPVITGAVDAVARRSGGGLLVHGDRGLFHDTEGYLVPSPLEKSLAGKPIVAIDALGEGDAEELWIATTASAIHVGAGKIETFDVEGASAPADVAVGAGPGQAVVSAGGEAFFIDITANTVALLATGLGKVHGHDRSEDDTVYLATDAGLLVRDKSGAVSLRTLAAAGQTAVPALGVAASFGAVMVVTASSLVRIDAAGATTLGELTGPTGALAIDANGDVWTAAPGKLTRFATGAKVSFAADVKPFFTSHCATCHAVGINDAPKDDFLDYATAKERSATILKRLAGVGAPVMPPATREVLTPSDYAVVTRWVGGGLQP